MVVEFLGRDAADADPALIRTAANLIPREIDPLRVIDIVGLDKQADGGTHVASTAEVGAVRVTGTESKGKGNKRVRTRGAPKPEPEPGGGAAAAVPGRRPHRVRLGSARRQVPVRGQQAEARGRSVASMPAALAGGPAPGLPPRGGTPLPRAGRSRSARFCDDRRVSRTLRLLWPRSRRG